MSIQGSVNQLFTIGGSFAGMYGLLHPEIAQSRQLVKDTKSRLDYVQHIIALESMTMQIDQEYYDAYAEAAVELLKAFEPEYLETRNLE